MAGFKRIFISAYLTILLVGIVYSIIQISDGQDFTSWSGLFVACFGQLSFFGLLFMGGLNLSKKYPHFPIVFSLVGLVMTFLGQDPSASGFVISSLFGWVAYNWWYSKFDLENNSKLEIGKMLPEFSLQDLGDKPIKRSSLNGKINIWVFFRGNWCPFCMAQIKDLVKEYQQLEKRNAQVILVSPQSDSQNQKLASKFDVPMLVFSDPKCKVARLLGILHEEGTPLGLEALGYETDTVMPTVIITGLEGEIKWVNRARDYRLRLEPVTYIKVIDSF